jgi:hypothetical protein
LVYEYRDMRVSMTTLVGFMKVCSHSFLRGILAI